MRNGACFIIAIILFLAMPLRADPPRYSDYKTMYWNGTTKALNWEGLRAEAANWERTLAEATAAGNETRAALAQEHLTAIRRVESNLGPISTVRPGEGAPPAEASPERRDDRTTDTRPVPPPAPELRPSPSSAPTDPVADRATDRPTVTTTNRPVVANTDRPTDSDTRPSVAADARLPSPAPSGTPRFAVDPFSFDEETLSNALRPRGTPIPPTKEAAAALESSGVHASGGASAAALLDAAKDAAARRATEVVGGGLTGAALEQAMSAFREAQASITKMEDADFSTPERAEAQRRAARALRRLGGSLGAGELKALIDEKLAEVEEVTWDYPPGQLAALSDAKAGVDTAAISDGLGKALSGMNQQEGEGDYVATEALAKLADVGASGASTALAKAGFSTEVSESPMLAGFLTGLGSIPLSPVIKKALKRLAKVSADAVTHMMEKTTKPRTARFQMPRQISRLLDQIRAPASMDGDEVSSLEWLWLSLLAIPGIGGPFLAGIFFALYLRRQRRGEA